MPTTLESQAHAGTAAPIGTDGADPVACDAASLQLLELARRVAISDCTVLIAGESGTGKEVVARFVHRHSARHLGRFVAVNCAAIPEHMLEAMLFGWERGAFTGAHAAHAGKFEQAQGGTLLLDEVSELPLALQAKLLRVLQEHEVERLGARLPVALDVRLLATTNRRLREEVAAGRFREDLYYRLNVFPLALSALRARPADILPLAMRLLTSHCKPGTRIPALTADAAQQLLAHDWPGNVRELDNVMQRALVLCDGDSLAPEHISFEQLGAQAPAGAATVATSAAARRSVSTGLAQTRAAAEYELILANLRRGGVSREHIAERLGISPRTLRYKMARMRAAGIGLNLNGSVA